DPDEARLKSPSRDSGLVADATPRNDGGGDWAERIVAARARRPFTSLEDFARDTGLPKHALILLADADAFRSIGLDRRAACRMTCRCRCSRLRRRASSRTRMSDRCR